MFIKQNYRFIILFLPNQIKTSPKFSFCFLKRALRRTLLEGVWWILENVIVIAWNDNWETWNSKFRIRLRFEFWVWQLKNSTTLSIAYWKKSSNVKRVHKNWAHFSKIMCFKWRTYIVKVVCTLELKFKSWKGFQSSQQYMKCRIMFKIYLSSCSKNVW